MGKESIESIMDNLFERLFPLALEGDEWACRMCILILMKQEAMLGL